ncbi:DHH family phosphoesterase [Calderihabitans maritimus]|uniref:Phosphoesterase, RecJ-like n=1 Tax=Calderihabitans maritimus TaxID=1246530 RepID=A0A1Z5HY84_9FIRM|nr:bifunctional oligoribonuclease/PAP phosphatase NrnA [Calderihabitans maritimus]GAW94301.1 phosphoesterase, RecJ-like [Calderihabitans maritimus]
MEQFSKVVDQLRQANEVLIVSHLIPDGDCLGSMLALAEGLQQLGKKAITVNGDEVPKMYRYLPGSEGILLPGSVKKIPEVIVFVDCTDVERAGDEFQTILQSETTVINIDHHISNTHFGDYNLINTEASAIGEIILRILEELNVTITPRIATALYTAIVTDTGSFQFENTTPECLEAAAKLLRCGAELELLRRNLWESRSLLNTRLLAYTLSNLRMTADGKIAWISLEKEYMDKLGAKSEDCEGLINYPKSIEGVEIGIFFREIEPGKVKVGFRSKEKVDVNLLASRFGGGGHKRAAGCTVEGSLETVIQDVIEEAEKLLRQTLKG